MQFLNGAGYGVDKCLHLRYIDKKLGNGFPLFGIGSGRRNLPMFRAITYPLPGGG